MFVGIGQVTGSFFARAKLAKELMSDTVFAQHGWAVSDTDDDPNHAADRLATNMNQAVSTVECNPISGSIPLRCSWCEVRKV